MDTARCDVASMLWVLNLYLHPLASGASLSFICHVGTAISYLALSKDQTLYCRLQWEGAVHHLRTCMGVVWDFSQ